jgi:hypothetical protein
MAKGTSDYVKPKQQTYREIDEALDTTTKPAPNQKAPTSAPKPAPAPKPVVEKKWWER